MLTPHPPLCPRYLGLVGLVNLMRSHPRVVAEHRELVQQCLLDSDVTVRLRALELITGMVTVRNLPEIVRRLLDHVQVSGTAVPGFAAVPRAAWTPAHASESGGCACGRRRRATTATS